MDQIFELHKKPHKTTFLKNAHTQVGKLQRSDYCGSESNGHLKTEGNRVWMQQWVEGISG